MKEAGGNELLQGKLEDLTLDYEVFSAKSDTYCSSSESGSSYAGTSAVTMR